MEAPRGVPGRLRGAGFEPVVTGVEGGYGLNRVAINTQDTRRGLRGVPGRLRETGSAPGMDGV